MDAKSLGVGIAIGCVFCMSMFGIAFNSVKEQYLSMGYYDGFDEATYEMSIDARMPYLLCTDEPPLCDDEKMIMEWVTQNADEWRQRKEEEREE